MNTPTPLLEAHGLTVRHGQLTALHDVSLTLGAGEVLAVVGANGAGKSTLLRTLAGLHRTDGTIQLDGADVGGLAPHRRIERGLVMVPEGRRLFPSLTVEENLAVGMSHGRPGRWTVPRVQELFPWMSERGRERADHLSGGEQQMVALGRALVANPRVLLLDEISLGLAPVVVQQIYRLLPDLLDEDMGVLVVEQDVAQALRVASRFQCLLEGRTTLAGLPAEHSARDVEAAYFGFASEAGR
jgi:branched-chain amino acid transport system ATP-binding protein